MCGTEYPAGESGSAGLGLLAQVVMSMNARPSGGLPAWREPGTQGPVWGCRRPGKADAWGLSGPKRASWRRWNWTDG